MPVDVGVALVPPEAEHVEPFARNGLRDRAADSVNHRLQPQVLVDPEVGNDPDSVLDGANEHIPPGAPFFSGRRTRRSSASAERRLLAGQPTTATSSRS